MLCASAVCIVHCTHYLVCCSLCYCCAATYVWRYTVCSVHYTVCDVHYTGRATPTPVIFCVGRVSFKMTSVQFFQGLLSYICPCPEMCSVLPEYFEQLHTMNNTLRSLSMMTRITIIVVAVVFLADSDGEGEREFLGNQLELNGGSKQRSVRQR